MKLKKLLTLALASTMVVSTMLGFAGCGKSGESTGTSTGTGTTEELAKPEDQELNIILLEPESLDVNAVYDNGTSTVLGAMHEGLFRYYTNKDGKEELIGAGAEEWEISDDGLIYTIKLRDYNWSDGKKVTAQHFVDSFRRVLDKEMAFPYAFFGYGIKNGEKLNNGEVKAEELGVVAKDESTLEITLERPDPTFLGKVSYQCFLPIRLDIIEQDPEKYATDGLSQVVCGPYKMESWETNHSITLVKNDAYWDAENINIEKVNMQKIQEFSTQAQLFESGQLDVTPSNNDYLTKWKEQAKEGKFQYMTGLMPNTSYFAFNNLKENPSGLMDNAKVRRAFSLAADRKQFVETIYGRYSPAYAFVPSVINIGEESFRKNNPEPLKAEAEKATDESLQALLKEGLAEEGVATDNLKDVKFKYIAYGDSALARQTQEFWKQIFETKLGITLEVEVFGDPKLYTAARKDMKFDLCLIGWAADYNDPLTFLDLWMADNGNNYAKYNNPEYDALLKSLEGENDVAKREEAYAKAEKLLVYDDAGIAPIYYGDMNVFLSNNLKGFQFPTFGAAYEWRWAYKVAE